MKKGARMVPSTHKMKIERMRYIVEKRVLRSLRLRNLMFMRKF